MKLRLCIAALLVVSLACAGNAQSLLRGDVVAGTVYTVVICPAPPQVAVFSDALTLRAYVYGSDRIAIDGIGRMYALSDIIFPTLEVFDTNFQPIRSIELLEPTSSFTVDETGRAFVVGESGLARIYSPEGRLVSSFALPNVETPVRDLSIDIAPDHCMLVYTGPHGAAERFDVCSGTALPAVGTGFDAVRALRDGGFAGAVAGRIEYFDRNGRLVSEQGAPTAERVSALAFGADGRTLWVASGGRIFALAVGVPAVRAESTVQVAMILSLGVFGERRPDAPAREPKRRSAHH